MKKRNNYKFDNLVGIESNISNISPYISYYHDEINGKTKTYSLEPFLDTLINKELIKAISSYISQSKTKNSKNLAFNNLRRFLNYLINLDHVDMDRVNYEFLYDYKIHLSDKEHSVSTTNRYYESIKDFLKFLVLMNYPNLHEDILNFDLPKSFKVLTKSSFDKDLEHYNKSIDFDDYANLINGFQRILLNDDIKINDKIVAFVALLSCCTGANPEVLFALTFQDIKSITGDFNTIDFVKIKNKKGLDCDIKIILKNYVFNGISISTCADKLYTQLFCQKRIESNDLFFKVFREDRLVLLDDYNLPVREIIKNHNIQFNSNFNFSSIRKTYERHIYKITDNLLITSSLMGHTKEVATKNYLNTSAGVESHQKLALTQDIIKGFSNNIETDNFVIYQKLLDLFDLDLESALILAKKGFPIDEIIEKAKRT
jgi:hypothetical protein